MRRYFFRCALGDRASITLVLGDPRLPLGWVAGRFDVTREDTSEAGEPRFCSNPAAAIADPTVADAELRDLIDAIHDEQMYVILDIVLNHAGDL